MAKKNDLCNWLHLNSTYQYDNTYETECGELFSVTEGTPESNRMAFCPYCGGAIHVSPAA